MSLDLEKFNAGWLKSWTDKDVPRLLAFYAEDCVYRDPQTPGGITGHGALRGYLTGLFGATPPMTYTPEEIWRTHNGYCGRWYCAIGTNGEGGRLRGFDLVVIKNERIVLNEVYVHQLPAS
jgi:hypothetical protein